MRKIFLDANILIDLITGRNANNSGVEEVFKSKAYKQIYISPLSVHIAFYVLKPKRGEEIFDSLSKIIKGISIIPLSEVILKKALSVNFKDYEDLLQYFSAIENCDVILTNDVKDFEKIKKLSPSRIEIISSFKG